MSECIILDVIWSSIYVSVWSIQIDWIRIPCIGLRLIRKRKVVTNLFRQEYHFHSCSFNNNLSNYFQHMPKYRELVSCYQQTGVTNATGIPGLSTTKTQLGSFVVPNASGLEFYMIVVIFSIDREWSWMQQNVVMSILWISYCKYEQNSESTF